MSATDNEPAIPISELAILVGVSRQSLYAWEKKFGCPIREGEAAVRDWMKVNKPEGATVHQQLLDAKLAKTLAEAERIEIENEVTKGRLIDKDAVERFLCQFVAECRARIEAWPDRCIVELPGESRIVCHDILREQVRLLLINLADMPHELFADETIATTPVPESAGD